ncbi:MAG: hypothetical protein QM621_09725 [Aeromicrobium sp.]|uniref:hypothetical protein n=1 Tax=Aeromicrobium sp. TaxID=1871063 RepID=UPI0039E70D9C
MSKWRRRTYDGAGVTEYPPGPHLDRYGAQKVYVTSPGSDDIGRILGSMGVVYEPYGGDYDCTILFLNCGTGDEIDTEGLRAFVEAGGCVYASDRADTLISRAFPGLFRFGGHRGRAGKVQAEVLDSELESVVGSTLEITFDLGSWALLDGGGETLIRAQRGSGEYAGRPLMAHAEYGRGSVFYTCFHTRAQTSEQEKRLLQLLVVKQFSTTSRQSFAQTSRSLGLSLS